MVFATNRIAILTTGGGSDIGAKLRLGKPVIDTHRCPRSRGKMSERKCQYAANDRKPPLHTRFKKGQSGNPRGRSKKNLSPLLVAALNEPVFVTIDGERRKITKREAVIHQLVNKSAGADLRATKMLIDMMKEIEKKAGAAPPPEPAPLTDTDANSSIRTCGSNNDRDTRIAGGTHGALMPCASLFLPGRGVGQAAHSVGVAPGRLQSYLAHQARVHSHKSQPFGFGERDVDAVIGGMIECQGDPDSSLEVRAHRHQIDVGTSQKPGSERRLSLRKLIAADLFPKDVRAFRDQQIGRGEG
jgi:hypothetical protein